MTSTLRVAYACSSAYACLDRPCYYSTANMRDLSSAAARAVQEPHHIKDSVIDVTCRKQCIMDYNQGFTLPILILWLLSHNDTVRYCIHQKWVFLFQNTHTHKIIIRREGITQIKPEPRTGNSALAASNWWYTRNKSSVLNQENFLLVIMQNVIFKTHLLV